MEQQEEKSKSQKIFDALASHKKIVIGVLIAIVVAVICVVVAQVSVSSANQKAQLVGEKIVEAMDNYVAAKANKDQKPNAFANRTRELNNLLGDTEGKYKTRFAGYKWAMVKSQLLIEDDKDIEAADVLLKYGKVNKHPLAPMMVMKAAALYEDADNAEAAKAAYKWVYAKKAKSPFFPEAAFNYARMLEAEGNLAEAKVVYAKIADKVEDENSNDFGLLAQSRIIAIDILLQEQAQEETAPDAE